MTTNLVSKIKALAALRGENLVELSKNTGIGRATIYSWSNGRTPNPEHLQKIAKHLGTTAEKLLEAEPTAVLENETVVAYVPGEDEPPASVVCIPEYKLSFAAGNGYEPSWEEETTSEPVWYRLAYFQSRHLNPAKCKRATVVGNSMEPLLSDGDKVLFVEENDPACVRVNDGSVYVLGVHGALKVKRLWRKVDGTLVIKSDNKAEFEDEIVKPEDQDNVRIYGRVIEAVRTRGF